MANRIKGITVEIGGDTTKLQTALKGVNSEIKNTQSQLRDVEKLLKLDPGNTELLAQKHRLLGDAVAETKEKLETLKTAAEQANTALANGDISQEQYDGLQRENIETENALRDLEEQANQSAVAVQKIADVGTKLQDVGGKIEGVGKSIMPVSAAVTGIGVAGLKVATDFETAMSGVRAITGATGEDFEKLRETAIDLGASTAFSSQEVAAGMTEMAKAGWSTQQIIDGMSGVLSAAAASGSELGTVSTIVADAITGFGLAAGDSARVADLLTQAANSGTIDIEDLGESFKYVAPVCSAMGFSIEDATTALAAMSMAGIKGSQAGTSLRTAFLNMASPTDAVAIAMEKIGLTVTDANGNFKDMDTILAEMRSGMDGMTQSEKENILATIAGKNAVSGLMSVVNMSQAEYDAMAASMDNCSGIAEETAAVMQDNLQSKIEQLGGSLESLAIKLADHVIPFLTSLVEKITSAVEWFTNLDPAIQKAVLVIGGIVAAAGPLLIIIGKVISAVGTIMTIVPKVAGAINAVKGAFAALGAVMAANPIILIAAAVAAAIAALVLLYTKCEWFRDAVNAVWQAVKDFFVQAWQVICSFFTETIPNAWNAVVSFFQAIPEWWSGLWQGISDFFGNIWTNMMNNPILSQITTTIHNLWQNLVSTLQGIWSGLVSIASGAWELLKNTVLAPVLLLIDLVTGNFSQLASDASNIWSNIQNAASQIWSGISQVVSSCVQGLVTHVTTLYTGLKNTASSIWSSMQSTASSLWSSTKNLASSIWGSLKNSVVNIAQTLRQGAVSAFQQLVSGIRTALGSLGSVVRSGFQSAISFITSLPSQALRWGADIINGIVNGIKSCIGKVASAVSNVASTIRSFLHFSVPDEGPLTDYESWMPDFIGGLARGIEQSRGMVEKAVSGVASDMVINPKLGKGGLGSAYDAILHPSGGSASAQAETVNLTQPVMIDGNVIATIVSEIQWAQGKVSMRNLGKA